MEMKEETWPGPSSSKAFIFLPAAASLFALLIVNINYLTFA